MCEMNSDNSLVISGECVVEAVDSLQSRKAKPDEQKIISYLIKKYRIKTGIARNLINQALAEGIVVKVNYADSISFRTPEKFGQMLRNHQNHIIPFDGSLLPKTAIKRVLIVMRQLLKSMPANVKKGIIVNDILKELHNTSQLLNYTQSILERLLRYALKQGYINRCETGLYTLTEDCKHLDELDYQTIDDIKMEIDKKEDNTIPDGASLLASQSLVSTQKGKKKINTAQVMQRVRPMSKRKKIKKTLGPDFLESSDLGMHCLRDAFEPKCDICGTNGSPTLGSYEELLHCNNCNAKAHRKCLDIDSDIGHKSQWQCMNCCTCYICQQDLDEYLLVCITCNKGFHTTCVTLNTLTKSKSKWNCGKCSTKQKILPNGVADKMFNNIEPKQSSTLTDTEIESNDNLAKCNAMKAENDDDFEFSDSQTIKIESFGQNKLDEQKINNKKCPSNVSEQHDELSNETTFANCENNHTKQSNNPDISDLDMDILKPDSQSTQNICLSLPESPQKWTVNDVETFIRDSGFPEQAKVFRDQEIDGRSLLLLRRMDVLTGLSLKLGPALKIYSHIMRLQGRDQFNY